MLFEGKITILCTRLFKKNRFCISCVQMSMDKLQIDQSVDEKL